MAPYTRAAVAQLALGVKSVHQAGSGSNSARATGHGAQRQQQRSHRQQARASSTGPQRLAQHSSQQRVPQQQPQRQVAGNTAAEFAALLEQVADEPALAHWAPQQLQQQQQQQQRQRQPVQQLLGVEAPLAGSKRPAPPSVSSSSSPSCSSASSPKAEAPAMEQAATPGLPPPNAPQRSRSQARSGAGADVTLPGLSLQEPFASLICDGAKLLEGRGSPMLRGFEGQWVAVRRGGTMWPSGKGRPRKLARPDVPFFGRRGLVVGVARLGRTLHKDEWARLLGGPEAVARRHSDARRHSGSRRN